MMSITRDTASLSATIIPFPASRLKASRPNAIEVQFDFGTWTLAYYRDHHFKSRLAFPSKAAAEAEAQRLAATGMTWRRGLNGTVYIMPSGADGGCWDVAHFSRSEGSDGILARYFSFDGAVIAAVRFAREMGAEYNFHEGYDGGAA